MERRTREEFEKLHRFLEAEEEARMEALKAEEEQKSQAMRQRIEEMTDNITALSETIRALEEELALEDISVLHVRLDVSGLCMNIMLSTFEYMSSFSLV